MTEYAYTHYSLAPSRQLFENEESLTRLRSCQSLHDVCEIIADAHNRIKGADEPKANTDETPLLSLTTACDALGGPEAVFDFYNPAGLWARLVSFASKVDRLFSDDDCKIPTLSQKTGNASIHLTAEQIACIMCNSFLCNLARLPLPTCDNPRALVRTLPHYGSLSWYLVYQSSSRTGTERVKGLLIYLQQVLFMDKSKLAEHSITFRRIQFLSQSASSEMIVAALLRAYGSQPLASVVFSNQGIEVQQQATALVDFANEDLHVGAVWPSATQEEVVFTAFPECFAGILFCETMRDAEAIQIVGARKFVKCHGFQHTFSVDGQSSHGPAKTIVAMDAAIPDTLAEQCSGLVRDRDILKAVCGFDKLGSGTVVATGNWGCGAFGGDPHAKFIHQLLAASLTHVSLVYCLVGDCPETCKLRADLTAILRGLQNKKVTAMELYQGLGQYDGRRELRDYLLEQYK